MGPAPESRSRWACHHLLRSFTIRLSVHVELLPCLCSTTFFLVSTEIAGSPTAWKAVTSALMCSNWALRSGWLAPSRVLALACRLKPSRRNSRPTSFWPAVKPLLRQRRRQMALAFAHPHQGRFRIAADGRLHQLVQGSQNPRLGLDRRLATAALSPNPPARHHRARTQVCQATINRAARKAGCPRHRDHPTTSSCARLAGREQPPPFLVQGQRERLKAGLDGSDIDHTVRIDAPIAASSQFPDSFVAFSPDARFFSSDSVIQAQALTQLLGKHAVASAAALCARPWLRSSREVSPQGLAVDADDLRDGLLADRVRRQDAHLVALIAGRLVSRPTVRMPEGVDAVAHRARLLATSPSFLGVGF